MLAGNFAHDTVLVLSWRVQKFQRSKVGDIIRATQTLRQIWIVSKLSLMKWACESMLTNFQNVKMGSCVENWDKKMLILHWCEPSVYFPENKTIFFNQWPIVNQVLSWTRNQNTNIL